MQFEEQLRDLESPGEHLLPGQQAVWTAIGIAAFTATMIFVPRTRILDDYRYLAGVSGIVLLLLPLLRPEALVVGVVSGRQLR